VADLERTVAMYCAGLELSVLGHFADHDGFDGAMLGREGADHHLEFTCCRRHPVRPSPTPEDLLVFYIPQAAEWERCCARMRAAGFRPVAAFNPYWDRSGSTFEDADGYRVVLQNAAWTNRADLQTGVA
jgi:catechol 2,3-dioxygenase-like lactoylglutathione lyase family enzyme